jgi:hypothetical protein
MSEYAVTTSSTMSRFNREPDWPDRSSAAKQAAPDTSKNWQHTNTGPTRINTSTMAVIHLPNNYVGPHLARISRRTISVWPICPHRFGARTILGGDSCNEFRDCGPGFGWRCCAIHRETRICASTVSRTPNGRRRCQTSGLYGTLHNFCRMRPGACPAFCGS